MPSVLPIVIPITEREATIDPTQPPGALGRVLSRL
jgi:hypothetical protein